MTPRPTPSPRRMAALALAVALLAGCATPGDRAQATRLDDGQALALAARTEALPAADWWRVLGDAQLDTLIEQALRDQPSLAVARERVRRAQAQADVLLAAHGPQAQLSASLTRQRYSEHGLVPAPIAGDTWSSGELQAALAWSPDLFGAQAAEQAAALGQARAARAEAAAAANGLATQIARGHVALARLLAQREVLQAQTAQRERIRQITQRRVAAGLDTRVEQLQADAALPDLRVQLEALDEQTTLLRRQLAVLSGQPPEALSSLSPRLTELRSPVLPATLGADLLGRRPDLVAARWRVEASLADVRAAEAAFYPSINLVAYAGLSALGLDRLFDLGSRQLGVQPALRLPLFDGGRLRAALQGRESERNAAIAQYNVTLLDAVREAGDALASEQSLQRQRAEQASALAAAEQAHTIAEKRYAAGLGNQLTVLATETAVLAQRRNAVDLQARQLDNRLALIKALGGGWTDDTALAAR